MGQLAVSIFFLYVFFSCLPHFTFVRSQHKGVAARAVRFLFNTLRIKASMKRLRALSVHQFLPSTARSGEQECVMKNWNCPKKLSQEHCFILLEALDLVLRKEYIFKHMSLIRNLSHSPLEFADSTLHWCFQLTENQYFSGCSTPYLSANLHMRIQHQ